MNNFSKQFLPISICLLPFFQGSLYAANKSADEHLVVTANRLPQSISDIAATVWLVDLTELNSQIKAGLDFKTALAQLVPSLDLASTTRTNYGQNMRGRPMMVMINGVSLNSSRGISRHLDAIDPFNIARIEVLSSATSIYGGGAAGGVINIITKSGQTPSELYIASQSGLNSSDDFSANVAMAYGYTSSQTQLRVAAAFGKTDALYDGDSKPIVMDTTQSGLQYTQTSDLLASVNHLINDEQSVSLLAQYYKNESDGEHGLYLGENSTALIGDMSQVSIKSGLSSPHVPKTARTLFNVSYNHQSVFNQQLNIQAFYRSEAFDFYPRPRMSKGEIINFSSSEQNTDAKGIKVVLNKQSEHYSLAYGVDHDSETFKAVQTYYDLDQAKSSGGLVMQSLYDIDRYPGFSVDASALFLQSQYSPLNNLQLSFGYRHQIMDNQVNDFVGTAAAIKLAEGTAQSAQPIAGGKTRYNVDLFNLGVSFNHDTLGQVWLNGAQAFELPNVAKYYGKGSYIDTDGLLTLKPDSVVNVATSRLKGIKTNSIELGWRYQNDKLKSQIAVYQSTSDQTIKIDNKTLLINVVDAPVKATGLEALLDYDLTNALRFGISGHLIRQVAKDNAGNWQRVTVTSASASKFTSYISWQHSDWQWRLQSKTQKTLDDDAGKRIDGYTLFDTSLSYDLTRGSLMFAVNNVFDKTYTTAWGQRAIYFYSPAYGPSALYKHNGQGRQYAVSYHVTF